MNPKCTDQIDGKGREGTENGSQYDDDAHPENGLIELNSWMNWSGYYQSEPAHIYYPKRIDELQNVVRKHTKVRVVGAGHSFTPIVSTEETLVSLDQFSSVYESNSKRCQSNIWAGTRLFNLGAHLAQCQQALINQGDIDQQSLAGAISTATHGTGKDLKCLSAYVQGFELVMASGEILKCSATENKAIFDAGRVSLGSFGILTKITMQNRPCYKLKENIRLEAVDEALDQFLALSEQHRHVECFIFPFTEKLIFKTLDITEDEIQPRKETWPSEDALLKWCSELTIKFPFVNAYLQKLLGVFIQPTCFVDWSSRIFAIPRETKFNEMEYQVPLEYGVACVKEVITVFRKHRVATFFPIEFRIVKGDDIWLSPFYQQDSIAISIHQYHKQDPWLLFNLIEPIFKKYQARPHWAKMHSLKTHELRALYPMWDEFMMLREQLDPERKFLNTYLEQLFLSDLR